MDNEILLVFNSNDFQDRETKGYAKALDNHKVKGIDMAKESLTEKQIGEIAEKLGGIEKLIDTNNDLFVNDYADKKMSQDEWLKVLSQNQSMIASPIAIYSDKAEFINSPYEFLSKDMNDNEHSFSYDK